MKRELLLIPIIICCWTGLQSQSIFCPTFFSDGFDADSLNPRWIVRSPNPDSYFDFGQMGSLGIIASPLNGGSDFFSQTNYNSPMILQPVCGDWMIETKLRFDPTNDYQDAGIIVFDDFNPFGQEGARVMFRRYFLNNPMNSIRVVNTDYPYTDTLVYFRLEKVDSTLTGWYSSDSLTWIQGAPRIFNNEIYYVGLNSIRQPWDNNFSVYSEAYFEYFHFLKQDSLCTSFQDTVTTVIYDTMTVSVTVHDTITVQDTAFVMVMDTIPVYDTIRVAVMDTLIISVMFTDIPSPMTSQVKVYPNPTRKDLFIEVEDVNELDQHKFELVNLLGQTVREDSVTQAGPITFNLSMLTPGLYILRVLKPNGSLVENRKIVLE